MRVLTATGINRARITRSQRRADWGMTISPVAHAAGLGFIPFAEEHYDFALVTARKQRLAVRFSTRSPRTKFAPC
jgi:molybdate-binding protein